MGIESSSTGGQARQQSAMPHVQTFRLTSQNLYHVLYGTVAMQMVKTTSPKRQKGTSFAQLIMILVFRCKGGFHLHHRNIAN